MSKNSRPFASPFSPNQMLNLMELPLDNVIQIFKFVDPADIFTLQRTCKKFLDLTLTRTVWLNALRRICEMNSLFEPSFPFDDMSLLELQRAATSVSRRFTKKLYKPEGDALSPFVSRILTPRVVKTSNVAARDPGVLKTLDLVPGGRFLFITTDTVVHLWDLGQGANKLIKPHALASIELPDQSSEASISFLPTPDGTGLEVMATSLEQDGSRKFTIAVYRIYPLATNPEFVPVTEAIPFPNVYIMRSFLVKPGRCVLHCVRHVYVWDTTRNLWAGWKTGESNKVFVHQDMLVTVGPRTISIWEMPIPSCETFAACRIDDYRPMMSLSHPFPRHEIEMPTSTDWFSSVGTQPCFLSLVGFVKEKRQIARYTMQHLDSTNSNLPRCIPILMDTVQIPDTVSDEYICDDIHSCGGDALTVWTSKTAAVIEVHISPMPVERKAAGAPFKSDFNFSLCAATGRLCTTIGQANEILVLDFLLPN
ncbi:hypothetical protein DFH07DRAFT_70581 [Mycena maculata]|uniref:F-box domain-containing protein n=1 Tax=Mycena maculata TaxID=230809 RepID=A0AAD7IEE6_9AGAR|nr:hypothetical protein DFH07DRAFT_70581 [Mycena maculata]